MEEGGVVRVCGGTRLGATAMEAPVPHARFGCGAHRQGRHCAHRHCPPLARSLPSPDELHINDLNMSAIGSVFLGDVQRQRHLSSSTPPSSPPPHPGGNAPVSFSDLDDADEDKPPEVKPPAISPVLSLELRLRWLETLLLGAKHDEHGAKPVPKVDKLKDGETLTRRAEDLQRRLDAVAQSNDALKRFMDRCELSTPHHPGCVGWIARVPGRSLSCGPAAPRTRRTTSSRGLPIIPLAVWGLPAALSPWRQ